MLAVYERLNTMRRIEDLRACEKKFSSKNCCKTAKSKLGFWGAWLLHKTQNKIITQKGMDEKFVKFIYLCELWFFRV
jgi:hypothetical protein